MTRCALGFQPIKIRPNRPLKFQGFPRIEFNCFTSSFIIFGIGIDLILADPSVSEICSLFIYIARIDLGWIFGWCDELVYVTRMCKGTELTGYRLKKISFGDWGDGSSSLRQRRESTLDINGPTTGRPSIHVFLRLQTTILHTIRLTMTWLSIKNGSAAPGMFLQRRDGFRMEASK